MLVTAGLNDPRVTYWEPAKWVAKLRHEKTDDSILLLKTNMEAGHGGQSGRFTRYGRWRRSSRLLLKRTRLCEGVRLLPKRTPELIPASDCEGVCLLLGSAGRCSQKPQQVNYQCLIPSSPSCFHVIHPETVAPLFQSTLLHVDDFGKFFNCATPNSVTTMSTSVRNAVTISTWGTMRETVPPRAVAFIATMGSPAL